MPKQAKNTASMDEERFWEIISKSRKEAEEVNKKGENPILHQKATLVNLLRELDAQEIKAFIQHWDNLFSKAFYGKLWGAANVIYRGYCGDKAFAELRHALIAHGKSSYRLILSGPESFRKFFKDNPYYLIDCGCSFKRPGKVSSQDIELVPMKVYKEKVGDEDLPGEEYFRCRFVKDLPPIWNDFEYLNKMYPELGAFCLL